MANAATCVLFIEFPELHIHLDPFIDSVYIFGSCHFRLYFLFCRNFAVPLMHPLFDLAAPYIAIPLYIAHLLPHPPAAAAVAPLVSPPQQVPSISPSEEEDPSKATSSSSSSSALGSGYASADTGMVNGFLSSESI